MPDVDVLTIRQGLRMTRERFGEVFGIPTATVKDWEQRRRQPDTAAKSYLAVIAADPEGTRKARAKAGPEPVAGPQSIAEEAPTRTSTLPAAPKASSGVRIRIKPPAPKLDEPPPRAGELTPRVQAIMDRLNREAAERERAKDRGGEVPHPPIR